MDHLVIILLLLIFLYSFLVHNSYNCFIKKLEIFCPLRFTPENEIPIPLEREGKFYGA